MICTFVRINGKRFKVDVTEPLPEVWLVPEYPPEPDDIHPTDLGEFGEFSVTAVAYRRKKVFKRDSPFGRWQSWFEYHEEKQ